ncbi:MAG: response regulator [Nitrospina sp.]|jgi:two-component system, chemotaxis family, protein-glutamate methylesterase/glutaminase|nr:response regulator [Nitrospina sp.]MBT3414142.1 response regulator [Nitrospina sp.]MBT3857940.1 response regulator [Nitrospina sp.]MBT4103582.1 response regulator [Nitrospina sp.]MBT4389848.1 response regulator [Nitrospina sp.]
MKILVAEDDLDNARLLESILRKNAHTVEVVGDGKEALKRLRERRFDALLTDWMMPEMDGVTLIQRVRAEVETAPFILMVTAVGDDDSRQQILQAGADEFLIKPYQSEDVVQVLSDGFARFTQPEPEVCVIKPVRVKGLPPFIGVLVTAGTGSPLNIPKLFNSISKDCPASYFVVQHGPEWMTELLAQQIRLETGFPCHVALQNLQPEVGHIYLAPSDHHLVVNPPPVSLGLNLGPKENFMRPSADILFGSASEVFGEFCVAVILSGMGRDGARGAGTIKAGGGAVFIESSGKSSVPSMPQTALESRVVSASLPLNMMGEAINHQVILSNRKLLHRKREE